MKLKPSSFVAVMSLLIGIITILIILLVVLFIGIDGGDLRYATESGYLPSSPYIIPVGVAILFGLFAASLWKLFKLFVLDKKKKKEDAP